MSKTVINSEQAPAPIGPYSQAIKAGNTLYVSGQIPFDQLTGEMINENITEETHQVMKNLIDVLNAAGSSLEKVIFARVYLVNFGDFDKMNSVYASYFAKDKLPARTCIGVTGLAVGASVEIDFITAC